MKKILVKFGTEGLMSDGDTLDQGIFDDIAGQISEIIESGVKVAVVSSGSIQAGREIAQELKIDFKSLHKKDLAGIGASRLLEMWAKAFGKYDLGIAQVWITYANLKDEHELKSISECIENYFRSGVVPIINENDVVADREIGLMEEGISENDRLTRLISEIIEFDGIFFATSVGGVFECNPERKKATKMYSELDAQNLPEILVSGSECSSAGTGGMGKKIIEAATCWKPSIRIAIASHRDNGIERFVKGESIGTTIGRKNELENE